MIFVNASTALEGYKILMQYASSPLIDPSALSQPGLVGDPPMVPAREKLFFFADTEAIMATLSQFQQQEGVNAVIQARSSDETGTPGLGKLVTLPSGVVLDHSSVSAAPTFATERHFTAADDPNSSIMAIIGRNVRDLTTTDTTRLNLTTGETEPGTDGLPDNMIVTKGTDFNLARVKLNDRALGITNGSSISPDSKSTRLSLVSILDGQLAGPTTPPQLLPGDQQPAGAPDGLARADVPPIVEIIDSSSGTAADPNFAVVAQSAFVVKAVQASALDPALLAASAPLASLINGTMKTTGDFASITGANARLAVTVPNDQLVLRAAILLNASQLNVGGNLFNVTGGAQGTVTGNLAGLANGSTLNLDGAFIYLGTGSSFTLQGGSLVAFGFGTNTVSIVGATCATCTLDTSIRGLEGIPVLLGPNATITVETGFVPFAGVGAGTQTVDNQLVAFNNTVNLPTAPDRGALVVGENATLILQK
jgi:hypothetical protein